MSEDAFAMAKLTGGQMNAIVKRLGGYEGALNFLRGNAEVMVKNHIIDCDAKPHVPVGWAVEEHQKGGKLTWNVSEIQLYLSDGQKNGKALEGNNLRKELANKPTLNANVLQYLLANPHLIPEDWKSKGVFFWGTIYRNSNGDLYVRYLCSDVGIWGWSSVWLDCVWNDGDPAALRAS